MGKSVLSVKKPLIPLTLLAGLTMLWLCGATILDEQQWLVWCNKCLLQSYNYFAATNIKKSDLNITYDGFVRYRKIYQNGKQEYFSFHLHRFKDLDFQPDNAEGGKLNLHTIGSDVIVQTYTDPNGDIDSMATTLTIPVRGLLPAQADSLKMGLLYLKANFKGR
jgi:hypothetical protein